MSFAEHHSEYETERTTGTQNKSGTNQKGQVAFLGIDLSKKSFQLHGVDAKGHVVIKKKLTS